MKISFHFVWLLSPSGLRGREYTEAGDGAGAWPGWVGLLMQRYSVEFISKVAKRKAAQRDGQGAGKEEQGAGSRAAA